MFNVPVSFSTFIRKTCNIHWEHAQIRRFKQTMETNITEFGDVGPVRYALLLLKYTFYLVFNYHELHSAQCSAQYKNGLSDRSETLHLIDAPYHMT